MGAGGSSSAALAPGEALIEFNGRDGLLYANGKPFSIKGVKLVIFIYSTRACSLASCLVLNQ